MSYCYDLWIDQSSSPLSIWCFAQLLWPGGGDRWGVRGSGGSRRYKMGGRHNTGSLFCSDRHPYKECPCDYSVCCFEVLISLFSGVVCWRNILGLVREIKFLVFTAIERSSQTTENPVTASGVVFGWAKLAWVFPFFGVSNAARLPLLGISHTYDHSTYRPFEGFHLKLWSTLNRLPCKNFENLITPCFITTFKFCSKHFQVTKKKWKHNLRND